MVQRDDAGETMADIVAQRPVEHLEQSGFVAMREQQNVDPAALGRGPIAMMLRWFCEPPEGRDQWRSARSTLNPRAILSRFTRSASNISARPALHGVSFRGP